MKYIYGKRIKTLKDRVTTLVASLAILANSAGVALPVLLTQKAYADDSIPAITNVDAYYKSGTGYTGIGVDFTTKNINTNSGNEAVKVELILHGGDTLHSIEAGTPLLNALNSSITETYSTSGTVVITGERTSSSGSWEYMKGTWTGSSRPSSAEVKVTLADGNLVSAIDNTIVNNSGNSEATVFADVPTNTAPDLTVVTPAEGSTVSTKVNNGADRLRITGSFTDDIKANYATMQLVKNGSSVAIGTLYGYGSVYNPAATYANADGTYTYDLLVPEGLTDGEYSLFYVGTDFTGGVTERMERKFFIDNTDPTFEIISPTNGSNVSGTVTIEARITDDSDITKVLMNIGGISRSWTNGSSSTITRTGDIFSTTIDTSLLPDGPVWVTLRGTDGVGNTRYWNNNANHRQHVFYVDNTAPLAVINTPADGSIFNGGVLSVTGHVSDTVGMSHYSIYLYDGTVNLSDGEVHGDSRIKIPGTWTAGGQTDVAGLLHQDVSRTLDTSLLDDGEYQIRLAVRDLAGNRGSTSVDVIRFTVDKTPPTFSLTDDGNPRVAITNGMIINPDLLGDRDSNGDSIRFTKESESDTLFLNDSPIFGHGYTTGKSGQIGAAFKNDGTYTLYTKDLAGNQSNVITFKVDRTAPTTPRITAPGARQWLNGSSTTNSWTPATDENGIAQYEVKYEYVGRSTGYRYTSSTSRKQSFTGSYQGPITISVRAQDKAGNWSPFSKTVTYNYDSMDPATDINVSPVVNGIFTVSGDASDNLALNRVYVQLASRETNARCGGTTLGLIGQGTNAAWSKTYDISTLGANCPEGEFAAHVSVVDMAGNSSTAGWTDNFLVDVTAPNVSVNDITAINVGNNAVVTGTIDDPSVSSVEILVNGVLEGTAGVTAGAFSFNVSGLSVGNHNITVRATDNAGNIGEATKSVQVNAVVLGDSTNTPSNPGGGRGGAGSDGGSITTTSTVTRTSTTNSRVTITDNNSDGDTSAEETTEEPEAQVLQATDTANGSDTSGENETEENNGCGKFLGLCWYLWIPIVIAVLGTVYYFSSRRADEK